MNSKINEIVKYGVYNRKQLVSNFTTSYVGVSYTTSSYGLSNLYFYAHNLGLSWPGWSEVSGGTVSVEGYTSQYRPDIQPGFLEGAMYCASYKQAGGGAMPWAMGDNYTYVRLFTTGTQDNTGIEINFDWNRRTIGVSWKGTAITPMETLPSLIVPGTLKYRIVGRSLYIATESGDTTGVSSASTNWKLVSNNLDIPSLTGRYINVRFLGYRYSNQAQSLDMTIGSYTVTTYR